MDIVRSINFVQNVQFARKTNVKQRAKFYLKKLSRICSEFGLIDFLPFVLARPPFITHKGRVFVLFITHKAYFDKIF